MGSISETPPSGPYVPVGYTLGQLNQDIDTTATDYNIAIGTLSAKTQAYNTKKEAVDAFLTAHNITDSGSWAALGDQEATLLQQYRDLVSELASCKSDQDAAAANLVTKATLYVDALARRQIYADTTDQNSVITALLSILNLPIPSQKISGMPPFPSLTNAQIATLQQAVSNINTSSDGTAAQNLLTAFTNLRHNEYVIAWCNSQVIINQGTADITWYHYLDPNDPTSMDQVNSARAAVTSASSLLNSYVSQRAGFRSALSSAISAYETAYASVKSPLSSAIATFNSYADAWQANLTSLYNASTQALAQQQAAFEAADTQSKSQHFETVTMGTLTEEAMAEELEAFKNRMAALQKIQLGTPEIPELPAATTNLSLGDLMRTISQVELTTWDLVRTMQKTEHDINSLRLQMALANLTLYAAEMAKFNAWAQQVYAQDISYNNAVDSENRVAYNDFAKLYNEWRDLLSNHLDIINAAVDEVNAQITIANQNASALVDLTNDIQPSVVDAINQERTSVPQSGNYLNFLSDVAADQMGQYASFSAASQIPLLPHFTGTELSALPVDPPLPDSAQLPDDFSSQVESINNAIAGILPELSVLQPLIEEKLAAEHPPISLPDQLEQLLLGSTIPVRDFQDALLAFQQPTTLLMGFIEQYLTSISSEAASKEEAALLIKMLKSTMTSMQVAQTSQVRGTTLGAASANVFASESTIGRALMLMASSDAFARMMSETMERAASLAGLNTASSIGISALGATSDETGSRALLLNTMVQLVLTAADPEMLRKNAMIQLLENADVASLSQSELEQVVSGLILLQQNMLMYGAISTGIQAGMSPGQILALLFPGMTMTGVGTVNQFVGMGFSSATAAALGAFALDNAPLISVLLNNGMSQRNILETLALLAASKGIVSLTSGVPGGPAFLDTIISDLKQSGIDLSTAITDKQDFIRELEAQLEQKVKDEDRAELQKQLLGTPEPASLGEPTAKAFLDFFAALKQAFTPLAEGIQPSVAARITDTGPNILINPSDIMQKYVDQFRILPAEVQASILASASTFMPNVTSLTSEQKGSIALAIRLGLVSVTDAANLIELYTLQAQSKLTSLDDIATRTAHQLFVPTDEEREKIREDLRQFQEEAATKKFDTEILNTLSKETLDQVKLAMTSFFSTATAEVLAESSYMAYARTVQNLPSYNTVFVNRINNPAKFFAVHFSLLHQYTKPPGSPVEIPVILSG